MLRWLFAAGSGQGLSDTAMDGEGGLLYWVLQWCLQAVIASRMETKPQAKRDQKKLLGRTTTSLGWATPSLRRQTQPTLTEATVDGAESGKDTKRT